MHQTNIKKELGLRIKSYRKQIGKTQEEFSFLLGIEQANLSKIENGKSFPNILTLCAIVEKTSVSTDFLLGFLKKDIEKRSSIDEKIFELVVDLPEEVKINLKNLLFSIRNN